MDGQSRPLERQILMNGPNPVEAQNIGFLTLFSAKNTGFNSQIHSKPPAGADFLKNRPARPVLHQ